MQISRPLDWIDTQYERMCRLIESWANVNSFTHNIEGLDRLRGILKKDFAVLGGEMEEIALLPRNVLDSAGKPSSLPLGKAIRIVKRPNASRRVFLCIHMDTVYEPHHVLQTTSIDGNVMKGPGVTDAKGGLAVMLIALEALERSGLELGWEVLINPDEEIGSPGSRELFVRAAKENRVGLLFEPLMQDGSMVNSRKGARTITVIVHGRSAHAGRAVNVGRNAIQALAEFIVRLTERKVGEATINIGHIEGGGPVNIVPDLAIGRINIRVTNMTEQETIERWVQELAADINSREGFRVEIHGTPGTPPKVLDAPTQQLIDQMTSCAGELGQTFPWKMSGGISDGNRLAIAGLPNLDSLGPLGGDIHSPDEFLMLESLVPRTKLTASFLMKLATGELEIPRRPS